MGNLKKALDCMKRLTFCQFHGHFSFHVFEKFLYNATKVGASPNPPIRFPPYPPRQALKRKPHRRHDPETAAIQAVADFFPLSTDAFDAILATVAQITINGLAADGKPAR